MMFNKFEFRVWRWLDDRRKRRLEALAVKRAVPYLKQGFNKRQAMAESKSDLEMELCIVGRYPKE